MQADLSGEEGERASKQASMPSCQRTPNERSVDLHTFDKKREREQRKGPSYSTAQVPRDWWGGRGGGGKERCVRARTRSGLGRGRAVAKCNAAGGAAATQRHKKFVKLREEGERYCTRMRRKECLTDGMEFHHAKERRTQGYLRSREEHHGG